VFPEFTLAFAQGIKARINDADALPDHDARKLLAESLWIEVDKQRKESTYQFGLFLITIDRAFEASLRDVTKSFVTDKSGKFEITPLSTDKYTVIVECAGFETQVFTDVKIKTGVTTRLNVKMVAVG
jgi:hypothetical protein